MRQTSTFFAALLVLAACGSEPPASPVSEAEALSAPETPAMDAVSQTEAINAFFEEKWDEAVARSPMTQTYLGMKGESYGAWDDPSMATAEAELQHQRDAVAEMKDQFDYDALDAQAQLSWRIAEYQLERAEADWPYRYHGYTFNQMFGVQSSIPAFLINQHRIATKEDADAYVERLYGIEDYLGEHVANSEESARLGIQPPRFVYDYVISDAENVITGFPFSQSRATLSPLYEDFEGKVDALVTSGEVDGPTAASLKADAVEALLDSAGPAYENLVAMMTAQAETATDEDGVWKLPDGAAYYETRLKARTTTDMTASEIHDLGLAETERIHNEMRAIMEAVEFDGTLQDFFEFMRTDEQFYYPNTEEGKAQYISEAEALIEEMKPRLPEVFNRFPKADMIVKAVEPFREQSAGKAFYQRPSADGSRPGTYYANLYRMEDMPTYQMAALAYHEGIPGHHMQIAIQQELDGVPSFRRFSGVTAYSEGWGLYSEYFPKEMGFYEDPYSDFGRLAMELWRAARLVVDTGLHDKQWTREEATQWLLENTPNPEGDARKAIDRYIVMPGQATAYKIGMNKILQLREHARAQLGEAFDIRDFHDVILENGPVPLAVLEENVETYIERTKQT
ncbi:MAG: DUF885 domain-containing protein [Hyphomonadaceae bacterium]|nr:DUF885 domain-containing protein [Hyphomonadaceae bacterium]